MKRWGLALLLAWLNGPALAALSATDGLGQRVTLEHPAQRIVALAPHAVELLYAAGAGAQVVAAVDYSDFPAEAKRLPRVGGLNQFSLETILRHRPDLVVAWADGTDPRALERLRALGVAVFVSRPLGLDDVARELEALGRLSGHAQTAQAAAADYRTHLARLAERNARRAPLTVFYQIGTAPLFTVGSRSFIDQMLRLCGGRNVFSSLDRPAAQVSAEAVVTARPQVMLATTASELAVWARWPTIPAVAHGTLYTLPADPVSRPGPRLAEGAEAVCRALDTARLRLGLTSR